MVRRGLLKNKISHRIMHLLIGYILRSMKSVRRLTLGGGMKAVAMALELIALTACEIGFASMH